MAEIQIRDTNVKITDILKLIGDGCTYSQITQKYPDMTIADIMMSAKVAEEIIGTMVKIHGNYLSSVKMEFIFKNGHFKSIDELQQKHKRAFVKWDTAEDNNLVSMYKSGKKITEIAEILQRTHGSIKARLERLGMIKPN